MFIRPTGFKFNWHGNQHEITGTMVEVVYQCQSLVTGNIYTIDRREPEALIKRQEEAADDGKSLREEPDGSI